MKNKGDEKKTEKTQDTEKVYHLVIEHIKNLAESGEVEFGSKIPSEKRCVVWKIWELSKAGTDRETSW